MAGPLLICFRWAGICVFIYAYMNGWTCLCINLSIYLSSYLPTCISIYLCLHEWMDVSMYLSIYPSIQLYIYPPTYLPIYLSIYPHTHTHTHTHTVMYLIGAPVPLHFALNITNLPNVPLKETWLSTRNSYPPPLSLSLSLLPPPPPTHTHYTRSYKLEDSLIPTITVTPVAVGRLSVCTNQHVRNLVWSLKSKRTKQDFFLQITNLLVLMYKSINTSSLSKTHLLLMRTTWMVHIICFCFPPFLKNPSGLFV